MTLPCSSSNFAASAICSFDASQAIVRPMVEGNDDDDDDDNLHEHLRSFGVGTALWERDLVLAWFVCVCVCVRSFVLHASTDHPHLCT